MEIDDLEMQEIDNIFNDAYKKTNTLREAWRYAMMRYAEIYHDREVKKLNIPAVSNNEVAVCEHEWVRTADDFDLTVYCKKCGKSS